MQLDIAKGFEWIATHVWSALREIGGVAILTAIFAFITHKMNTRYEKRISAKFDKEIEELKSVLENRGHISKARFDTEFAIHKELSRSFYQLISAVHWLFPSGLDRAPATGKWEEICKERYRTAQEKYNDAASSLGGNAPFINDELYNSYQAIMELAAHQIHAYSFSEPLTTEKSSPGIQKIEQAGYERTQEIDKKWKELLDSLRQYLNSLTDE